MGPDEFNACEVYYRTADGGEFKLLPIKALSVDEINFTQSEILKDLCIDKFPISMDFEVTKGQFDEFFEAIYALQRHEDMSKSMYCICEMAKRYLYLLKEKDQSSCVMNGQITIDEYIQSLKGEEQ